MLALLVSPSELLLPTIDYLKTGFVHLVGNSEPDEAILVEHSIAMPEKILSRSQIRDRVTRTSHTTWGT